MIQKIITALFIFIHLHCAPSVITGRLEFVHCHCDGCRGNRPMQGPFGPSMGVADKVKRGVRSIGKGTLEGKMPPVTDGVWAGIFKIFG